MWNISLSLAAAASCCRSSLSLHPGSNKKAGCAGLLWNQHLLLLCLSSLSQNFTLEDFTHISKSMGVLSFVAQSKNLLSILWIIYGVLILLITCGLLIPLVIYRVLILEIPYGLSISQTICGLSMLWLTYGLSILCLYGLWLMILWVIYGVYFPLEKQV